VAVFSKSYNAPLNGYRGLCALAVFLYHAIGAGLVPLSELGVLGYASSTLRYGVELFFMISGFVIAGSLQRQPEIGAFLRDRFIRIYSAWAPAVAVLTLAMWALRFKLFEDVTASRALGIFLLNFYLVPPFVPQSWQTADGLQPYVNPASWSLTYEWVFYLAAAACVALRYEKDAPVRALRSGWLVLVIGFVIAFPRALFFLPGLVVFRYARWFERHKALLRMPWLSLLTFLFAWSMTGADKAELTETMLDWARDGRLLPALLALLAAIHMFASITLCATPRFKFLETRPFQFLGKISYSFYLWHAPVIGAAKRLVSALIVPQIGAYAGLACLIFGSLALTVPLAWAAFEVCEVRFASWLRELLKPQPTAAILRVQISDAE